MSLWPLALYALFVIVLAGALLGLSHWLGEKLRDRSADTPYEAGMIPTGSARGPLSIQFFMVAMFFVIFDIEIVFLLTWAVAARELGAPGFAGAVVFIVILLVALYYEHREGALLWGTSARLARQQRESLPSH